ncbi:MAG: FAD-dependent oxidoreductase [Bacteroidetes bacterium]|nr:FAD-dependent oxidoreductase [Bacteroidota bacterium]
MRLKLTYLFSCVLLLISQLLYAQRVVHVDVLVVGGGTSGIAAGVQAARLQVKTLVVEETLWLGGMLSAAGVSATDGNHLLPSGLWGEFRARIYTYYGGPSKVATGWVSNTHFEPHVANQIWKDMAAAEKNLQILYQYQFLSAIVEKNAHVAGARFVHLVNGDQLIVYAKQVVDATELGDVMASAAVPFDVGMEASAVTGENVQVPSSNDIIQDLTYVAILKDYGRGVDCTIAKPVGYDPTEFDGCCLDFYKDTTRIKPGVDCAKMITYAKLPGNKYMLNWPGHGNDIYLNLIQLAPAERAKELMKAKQQTLRYIYFLQHQLGYKNLGLADDEFPTADRLALIPYNREGRRLRGVVRFKVQDISKPFDQQSPLYRTGVAVGDYPIDHHHRKNPAAPQHLGFYPIPSFSIPMGTLLPETHTGLVVAEKGISVSNVVNGTTRLQPCVLLIGQAAGVLAAVAVKNKNKDARQVSVRQVQSILLQQKAYLMPYADVSTADFGFEAIQRVGASGFLRGKGQPNAWANRTWFEPDSTITVHQFVSQLPAFAPLKNASPVTYGNPLSKWVEPAKNEGLLSLGKAIELVGEIGKALPLTNRKSANKNSGRASIGEWISSSWMGWGLTNYRLDRPVTKRELAILLDKVIDPFYVLTVNHQGNYTSI